jgi:peptidyl-prolyl cis-trans isomerase B (cyclophilin B)
MIANKKTLLTNLILVIFLGSLLLTGCNSSPTNVSSSSDKVSDAQVKPVSTNTSSKEMFENLPRLEGMAKIELMVKGSPIVLEINGKDAPITAGNFVDLVQKGVYDGLVFHRVIKAPQPFVAQGGDPQGKDPKFPVDRLGTGGYVDESGNRRFIPLEVKLEGESEPTYNKGLGQQSGIASPKVTLKHARGALAMARSAQPDSASSQFYIALADLDFLDGDYAVFGKVLSGMDVVDGINQGDRIDSAKVIEGAENLK